MLFVLYGILLIGGIYILALSFTLPAFQALVFIAGILIITGAVAVPILSGVNEHKD